VCEVFVITIIFGERKRINKTESQKIERKEKGKERN